MGQTIYLNNPIPLDGLTRQLIWSYYKKASVMAGIELGEQQDQRKNQRGMDTSFKKIKK